MKLDYLDLIPVQREGKEIITDAIAKCEHEQDAIQRYMAAKSNLLNVNGWHELAGIISAQFHVVDEENKDADREVQKGDYIKIDIPGPGSSAGDGYDWVYVEAFKELVLENNIQSIGFRVRPTKNPTNKEEGIAHFYDEDATSTFMVTRDGASVYVYIIDRNLKPNKDAASLIDKIRDTSAGIGAIGLFSKIQWQNLADGILKKTEK